MVVNTDCQGAQGQPASRCQLHTRAWKLRLLGGKSHPFIRFLRRMHISFKVLPDQGCSTQADRMERLGRGAFGSVYLHPERNTALKVVTVDRQDMQTFRELLAEYRRARQAPATALFVRPLCHWVERLPRGHGKPAVYQYVQEMPAVLGGTLAAIIKANAQQRAEGRLPSERGLRRLLVQLLGLTHLLHTQAGLVHRDLKPANILMSSTAPVMHICDFGGATPLGQVFNVDRPNDTICTAKYAAPEMLNPQAGALLAHPSQDMFSIGVMLYQLLVGPSTHPLVPPELLAALKHTGQQDSDNSYFSKELFTVLQPEVVLDVAGGQLADGYSQAAAWQSAVKGLCAVRPEDRWTYHDAISSCLVDEQELQQWAASAQAGAALRYQDRELGEARSLAALSSLYEQVRADKLKASHAHVAGPGAGIKLSEEHMSALTTWLAAIDLSTVESAETFSSSTG